MQDFISAIAPGPKKINKKHYSASTYPLITLTAACAGASWLVRKKCVAFIPLLQLSGARLLIGGCLYLAVLAIHGEVKLPPFAEWKSIVIRAALLFVLGDTMLTWSLLYIPVAITAIFFCTIPLWLFIQSVVSGKRVSGRLLISFALGFAGVVLVLLQWMHSFLYPRFWIGLLLALGGACLSAVGISHSKNTTTGNPFTGIALEMILAGAILLLVCYATGTNLAWTHMPNGSWTPLTMVVVVLPVIGLVSYQRVHQTTPATGRSVYWMISLFTTLAIAKWMYHEPVNCMMLAGSVILVAGIFLLRVFAAAEK